MSYFRKRLMLIANVPVDRFQCRWDNILLRYLVTRVEFALLRVVNGRRGEVHTSMTTRYRQDEHTRMMELPSEFEQPIWECIINQQCPLCSSF